MTILNQVLSQPIWKCYICSQYEYENYLNQSICNIIISQFKTTFCYLKIGHSLILYFNCALVLYEKCAISHSRKITHILYTVHTVLGGFSILLLVNHYVLLTWASTCAHPSILQFLQEGED
jgi:hypothetical protein